AAWKKTIATDHTCGAPPSRGSTILVNIGWTANRSAALRKMAAVRIGSSSPCWAAAGRVRSPVGRSVELMARRLSAVAMAVAGGGTGITHGRWCLRRCEGVLWSCYCQDADRFEPKTPSRHHGTFGRTP